MSTGLYKRIVTPVGDDLYREATQEEVDAAANVLHPTARDVLEAMREYIVDPNDMHWDETWSRVMDIWEPWKDEGFPISTPETAALRELSEQRDALLAEVEKRRAPETIRAHVVKVRTTNDAEIVLSLTRYDARRLAASWDRDVEVVVPHE